MFGYPIEKARDHVFTTAITSRHSDNVYVYCLHERKRDSGEYIIELLDVFKYSHAVQFQSHKDMILDALVNFTNHQVYRNGTIHIERSNEGLEWVNYGYTGFSDIDLFSGKGFSSFKHRAIVLASLYPFISPAMIQAADKYAKSLIKDDE